MDARELFEKLSCYEIEYGVMRNFSELPHIIGTDLDIYINPNDKIKFKAALLSLSKNGIYHVIPGTSSRNFDSFMIFDGQENLIRGFRLDVNYGFYFRGERLLKSHLEHEITYKDNICCFSDNLALLCIWLKCFANGEPIKYQVWLETKIMLSSNKRLINDWLMLVEPSFLERQLFLEYVAKYTDMEDFCEFKGARYKLNFGQKLFSLVEKTNRYLKPGGLWITFVGVDGSGKSTFIDQLKKDLINPTHGKISVYHFRPKLLPARSQKSNPPAIIGAASGTTTFAKWMKDQLKLLYLFCDYFFGYFFKVRVELAGRGGILVFDRYSLDLLYDPKRINVGKMSYFWTCLWKMLPQPDATFVIMADANQVLCRKQERGLAEIVELQNSLNQLALKDIATYKINNDADFTTSYGLFSRAFMGVVKGKGLK